MIRSRHNGRYPTIAPWLFEDLLSDEIALVNSLSKNGCVRGYQPTISGFMRDGGEDSMRSPRSVHFDSLAAARVVYAYTDTRNRKNFR